MRIVVLTKPVPDPASGAERLLPDGRLDRAASPAVVNGNDEYVLEKALKLVEAAGEGEVILLSMAPASAPETMRKALAMGAHRGVLVTDPALEGSCTVATTRVLAAALKTLEFDLVFAGVDTSDGVAGVVPAGVAALNGLPYLSYAAQIEPDPAAGRVRVQRISPTGYDVLEAPMPALISGTQALGEPRYPSLKGIMAARWQGDRDAVPGRPRHRPGDGRDGRGDDPGRVVRATTAPGRDPGHPRGARRGRPPGRHVPRRPEAHLMAGILVVGRGRSGRLPDQALDGGRHPCPLRWARRAASFPSPVPTRPRRPSPPSCRRSPSMPGPPRVRPPRNAQPSWPPRWATPTSSLVPASPDGRDFAGVLSALTGRGVLANATGASGAADAVGRRAVSVFGGKLQTTSSFTSRPGIVTVRPNSVTAEALPAAGTVDDRGSRRRPRRSLP